jgi:hypothetical protein
MNAEWWEGTVRFVNDYWWVFLLIIVLSVTAYFTRDYWLPLLGF